MTEVAEREDFLIFTDSAATKVRQLLDDEANHDLKLRVYISGGGCAGFQYGFMFDESEEPGDAVVENHGVTLLVEGIEGAQFVIRNPNATTTCGCGSSFGV